MGNNNILHFTFSPVQGFVSQARRTRDLWAGSYLLSWLAGKAMEAVVKGNGTILLPDVKHDPLFQQILSPKPLDPAEDRAAYLGSLPNRFTASIPENMNGSVCAQALEAAWIHVAKTVHAVVEHNFSSQQKELWKKQTENFWECTWVLGKETYLLDQRKNLRIHLPPAEDGEKCTLCGERQELSCAQFPKREEIKMWWENLRQNTPVAKIHGLDLKENERLCAICLIKRLFPHVAREAIGWQVPEFYPSTAYLAAVDWIIRMLELAKEHSEVKQAAVDFLKTVDEAGAIIAKAEKRTWRKVWKIKKLTEQVPELETILQVDGVVFFRDAIFQDDLKTSEKNKKEMAGALKKLQEIAKNIDENFSSASPFYALLLMDGDNMGALIGNRTDSERTKISRALSQFTGQVAEIVHAQNGLLIYAGGDDVFALIPVSTAIECARRCRFAYQCAFKEHAPFVSSAEATISAAVQYAHMNTALGVVVRDAHRLLEETAKDKTGRDALACKVWKRGGPVLTWSQPWNAIDDGLLISAVQKSFTDDTDQPDRFSSKFFYKLSGFFELINVDDSITAREDIEDLLVAEYLANREHTWPDDMNRRRILEKSRLRVGQLLSLCRQHCRSIGEDNTTEIHETGVYYDAGALLVRFLTMKEV